MKIIAFHRGPDEPVTLPPRVDVIPDSAVTVANRPLFLPDFAPEWTGTVSPAFRISRLGKEISRKFASRYTDAVTLALRIAPAGMTPGEMEGIWSVFDGCITLGDWLPLSDGDLTAQYAGLTVALSPQSLDIDGAIEAISHYCTLKTGDVILPCSLPVAFPVLKDHPFAASLGSSTFSIKIK